MLETWVQFLGWEDLLEKKWQPTPVLLPGESPGRRSLADPSLWGCKEADTTEHRRTGSSTGILSASYHRASRVSLLLGHQPVPWLA